MGENVLVSVPNAEAEKRLGLSLFDRIGRQVTPTEVALMIAGFVREKATLADELMERINAAKEVRAGRVTIAAGEGFLLDLIQTPPARYHASHPDVGITVEAMRVDAMITELVESRFEMGIAHNPHPHPALRRVLSRYLPIDLIVPAASPLAQRQTPISIAEIAREKLALLSGGYGLRKAVEVVEYVEKLKFQPVLVTNSLNGLKGFVLGGMGVVMIPALVVREEIRQGKLAAIPIEHTVMAKAEMHLLVRKGRRLSPAGAKALVETTRYLSTI